MLKKMLGKKQKTVSSFSFTVLKTELASYGVDWRGTFLCGV